MLAEGSNSRVVGNNIAANTVTSTANIAGGGGIYTANSDVAMWNNVLRANRARGGGGLCFTGTGTWLVLNNTLVANSATGGGSGALGGGMFVGGKTTGKTSIVSNMFVNNNNYQIFDSGRLSGYANNLADQSQLGAFYGYGTGALASLASLNGHSGIGPAYANLNGNSGFVNGGAELHAHPVPVAVDAGSVPRRPRQRLPGAKRPYGRYPESAPTSSPAERGRRASVGADRTQLVLGSPVGKPEGLGRDRPAAALPATLRANRSRLIGRACRSTSAATAVTLGRSACHQAAAACSLASVWVSS